MMNRYGFPGHLEPWSEFAPVEVEFNKVYKALHDAGYNVLTYDMRNHGHSGAAHGGVPGYGLFEWRDVAGAQAYVQQHPNLKEMTVGLFNPCAGGNAAMVAMNRRPDFFEEVKAFVCPQPCSARIAAEEIAKLQGIGEFVDESRHGILGATTVYGYTVLPTTLFRRMSDGRAMQNPEPKRNAGALAPLDRAGRRPAGRRGLLD
ncbi:MAG: alpha/beta hydrolase [Acidobacteriota bacterium]